MSETTIGHQEIASKDSGRRRPELASPQMKEETMYQRAWKLLIERIEQKTGWGKVELKQLMLQCLVDAGEKED